MRDPDGWRMRWRAIVVRDVGGRGGLGWEFTSLEGEPAWSVFREDGGPFPVFASARGSLLPPRHDLAAMTAEAVRDLLNAVELDDPEGWITKNITAALTMSSLEITGWEGEEWAIEAGPGGEALAWAGVEAERTPFAWLRAFGVDTDVVIDVYQDDALFGLSLLPVNVPVLRRQDQGLLRTRRDVPLVRGRVMRTEVALDTLADGGWEPGVVSELLLQGETSSTLFIAAEAYSRDEWHLHDESVVVLSGTSAADALSWIPERRSWTPAGENG